MNERDRGEGNLALSPASSFDARRRIDAAVARLIDEAVSRDDRRSAAVELESLYRELAGELAPTLTESSEVDTGLSSGSALAPSHAARCVRDAERTARFVAGLLVAIERTGSSARGRPVRVLYAGCGPYAALAVPAASRFDPDRVRFTLVDAHASAVASARRIFEELGRAESLEATIAGDATEVAVGRADFDVALVEAMGVALFGEPHVAIARRIARLLAPGGVLVPSRVTLSAQSEEEDGSVRDLGRVFELSLASAREPSPAPTFVQVSPRAVALRVRTEIEVVPGVVLGPDEAEITTTIRIGAVSGGERLRFDYEAGPKPGLRASAT